MPNCLICNSVATIDNSNIHEPKVTCPSCGKYAISDVAFNVIPKDLYPNWNVKLQDWIRLNQNDGYVLITQTIIKSIF